MSAQARPAEAIRTQAARWFTRMQSAGAAGPHADTVRDWHAWMRADPMHAQEYAAFESLWRDFDATPRAQALADAMHQRRGLRRRAVTRGVLGVASFGLLGLLARQGWNAFQDHAVHALQRASGVGERIALTLPDGSRVTLGPASRIALRYTRRQRSVVLGDGDALFDVAPDSERPFVIDAGAARVRVVGTRFVINQLPGVVRVSVTEGRVQFGAASSGQAIELQRGEVGELALEDAQAAPRRVQRDAQDAFAAPERGLIVFDRAPLAEIAATLSRWRAQPVRAEPDAGTSGTGGPRITAAVRTSDIEGFLHTLPGIAAVRLRRTEDALWLSPAPPSAEKNR